MMSIFSPRAYRETLFARLRMLYPRDADQALERLEMMVGRYGVRAEPEMERERWNQRDAVLITYGDSVISEKDPPLKALRDFATEHLTDAISTIHLLPFFPFSSDDGFSVTDYRAVDPALGDWRDIEALRDPFQLMFDLVLNHISAKSSWFQSYLNGILPYRRFFLEVDPSEDLSSVTRPRTSPLLTEAHTQSGTRHVWTTFSADQVDLNWANPDVFFEMLDVLLGYIARGARIIRLDAVGFLWKKIGTACIHLPETHEGIKLLRAILDLVAPHVILLTETNVPHEENLRYFGRGDEAHMVYQFALPPLILHGLLNGTAKHLSQWVRGLAPLPPDCTFLNFTASHDGIGVRALEGILSRSEIDRLAKEVKARGGYLSYKSNPDGSETLYEMNATYYDALADPGRPRSAASQSRFLCSQLVALALKGVPAVYIHSLLATANDHKAVEETGIPRRVNRHKWRQDEIAAVLSDPHAYQRAVFQRYVEALRRRGRLRAFHPDASQRVLSTDDRVFGVQRTSLDEQDSVVCLHNFSAGKVAVALKDLQEWTRAHDALSQEPCAIQNGNVSLDPYQVLWLRPGPAPG